MLLVDVKWHGLRDKMDWIDTSHTSAKSIHLQLHDELGFKLESVTMSSINPRDLGYRMPAEWEPHARTWMGWPERPDNWREDAKPAQAAFAAVIKAIAEFEPVMVCCNPLQMTAAETALLPHDNIEVIELSQDDAWFRDTGPTFVVRNMEPTSSSLFRTNNSDTGEPSKDADLSPSPRNNPNSEGSLKRNIAGIDWDFNAWGGSTGGLYPDWQRDKLVASRIISLVNPKNDKNNNNVGEVHLFRCPIVLEGGSIHVDGKGTCLTTEECLLNPNRNPSLTKQEIESWLGEMLGIKKVIWLPRGLYGDDDTNGHIDNFACFARNSVVLLAWTDDEADPQFEISVEALKILQNETDVEGNSLQVVKLPLPRPMYSTPEDVLSVQAVHGVKTRRQGVRLAGSYVNLYICNGGVVMPGLGDEESDAKALAVVKKVFPERKIVQVQTREVLLGGGNIHCITQQQPK